MKQSTCIECSIDFISKISKKRCNNCQKDRERKAAKISNIKYKLKNLDKIKQFKKNYYERNKTICKERSKNFVIQNSDYVSKRSKLYYEKNKGIFASKAKLYRNNNKEQLSLRKKLYYRKNKNRLKKYYENWKQKNRKSLNAIYTKHKLTRSFRVPKWSDLGKIKEIYKNCPDGYQVDHIVPLKGKTVSGLHVPNNLQYLTPKENMLKKNFFKDEYLLIKGVINE
jgi:hypothetical protein